jgi:hypothetical protein
MEVLVFALVAMTMLYRREEKIVPETHHFQPFDVQALKRVYNARYETSGRPSDRQKSYVVTTVS